MAISRPAGAGILSDGLELPGILGRGNVRTRLAILGLLSLAVVSAVALLPGVGDIRSRLSGAEPGWLGLGGGLEVLSCLGFVAVFRSVFCKRFSWRVSYEIGMSELGANAIFSAGGAGGLALGAWALRRGGMPAAELARRSVAFFLLTSVANVVGVVVLGAAFAIGLLRGESNLVLTLVPAVIAAASIGGLLLAAWCAPTLSRRLESHDALAHRRGHKALLTGLTVFSSGVGDAITLLRARDALLLGGILAYLVFDVLILWASFVAFGAPPPLAVLALAYLIGALGGLIPVPGGIGGVDVGLVGTSVLFNVPFASAAAAVLAYRVIALLVPAAFGSAAFIGLRRTLRDRPGELEVPLTMRPCEH
jgi:uncharacterized protein (TIRG00374 family)